MDQQLYDEFGNYIGPEIESEESQQSEQQNREEEPQLRPDVKVVNSSNEHRIILHEDKKYYQTHQEMYPEAQILIEQEDRQTLETPIVPKIDNKKYDLYEGLQTYYSTSYLKDLMKNQKVVRNICVAGHLHHGKTLLMDLLVHQAHVRKPQWNLEKNYRWLDSRVDEQQRQLSIKATPITLLLPDFNDKHFVLNIVDTPGHPNFLGETVAGMRLADGVVLVIDAIQGVMLMTQKIIKHCIRQKLKVIIVINKIDRLIIQSRIPPEDAYLKLKHTLQQVNALFRRYSTQFGFDEKTYHFSPSLNNVIFASAQYGFMFSNLSMSLKYQQRFKAVDVHLLSKLLWGDYYFNHETKKFSRQSTPQFNKRTFVEFVLQPIYKIFSHTVGKDRDNLEFFLVKNLDVFLTPEQYKKNIKTMMKIIFYRYFKNTAALIQACIQHFPAPNERNKLLIDHHYKGQSSDFKAKISEGKSQGPLYIHTTKMYHQSDYKTFDVLGRVLSGTIKRGDSVKVLGEGYEPGDQEEVFVKQASKIYLLQGRYKIQCDEVSAGNYVLISGIDQAVTKTSTIIHSSNTSNDVHIMEPLKYWSQPTIKVAIEPLVPSELPKMVQAIRRVNKSYLMLKTKVEESGEHVLVGNGEIHLDCILNDIRNLYSDIEVRISDPCVTFCETVSETSGIPCYADTPNKKNRFTTLAGPLHKDIAETVEKQLIDSNPNSKELRNFLQNKFNWDILASTNIWSFGPDIHGPNVLINDSLVQNADQQLINRTKPSIVQGFKWSTREGPLCDQPMRNVKFRLMNAEISKNMAQCPPGQVIPTTRRAFYSSFLTANPRLMEPVYLTEIQCTTSESIDAVFTVLAKRRGAVQNQVPKPGTPHYVIKALIPCIEAIGFETDLRVHTVGQAFCLSTFDHWQVVPGDPLDKKIVLRPLQVHEHHELAREFMVKTRRRKGLNEEVSIVKYFDDLGIKEILKNDVGFREFI